MECTQDEYIEEMFNDERYKCTPEGGLWTRVLLKGKGLGEWRPMGVYYDREGYGQIKYRKRTLQLHRVIYRWLKGPLKEKMVINHIDGNPSNNSSNNLELITQSKNLKKSVVPRPNIIKLNQQRAQEIRQKYKDGIRVYLLAREYSVSERCIQDVIQNITWIR